VSCWQRQQRGLFEAHAAGMRRVHAAAALQWSEQRERDRIIYLETTPGAYLVQRFHASRFGAVALKRAATWHYDEDSETPWDTEEFEGEDDIGSRVIYRHYHTHYARGCGRVYEVDGDRVDEREDDNP
jgi:hypothetical protein